MSLLTDILKNDGLENKNLPCYNLKEKEMQKAAEKEGLYIIIDSGYRSYEYQQIVFYKNVEKLGYELALKYAALPGESEHQTGYAFDVASFRNGKYFENKEDDEKEIVWMMKNCYKYGFILRYPKGKEEITGDLIMNHGIIDLLGKNLQNI